MSPTSTVTPDEYFLVIMESRLDARGTAVAVVLVRGWVCAKETRGYKKIIVIWVIWCKLKVVLELAADMYSGILSHYDTVEPLRFTRRKKNNWYAVGVDSYGFEKG